MKPENASEPDKRQAMILKIVLAAAGVLALVYLLRGFLWAALEAFMLNVLPILFTPVILELSVGFAGLFIVLLFCYLRRKDQEDEWVYISQVEPEAEMEQIPEPLRRRVGDTVLGSKLEAVGSDDLPFEAIEGLVDLGLFDEAQQELKKGDATDRRKKPFARLQLQVDLRQKLWAQADELIASRPASSEDLAVFCVEAARFFIRQKPRDKEAATRCLEMGKALSVNAVVNAIDSDSRLQKLA